MSYPNGNYNYRNSHNVTSGTCNIKYISNNDTINIVFDKPVMFSTLNTPTNKMTFNKRYDNYYSQISPTSNFYNMVLGINIMKMFSDADPAPVNYECVFTKQVRENFTSDCCSARAKFVDLKNTWTKQGSTNKTTWLPYNTRGKSLVQKDVKEDYCSSCNGYRYSPNIFTGTTISNTTPRDQLWKTVPLTDRTVLNGIAYPGIQPQQISDNHNIYNISSRYNSNPHRNPMRYPMRYPTNVNDCDSPSHYKELNHTYCKD